MSDKEIDNLLKSKRIEAQRVDAVFLLDCTGSMGSHIRAAKEGIFKIQSNLKREFPEAKLRSSFVGYRDYGDGNPEVLDFTADVSEFSTLLGSVVARGGGDFCEDVFGGFERLLQLNWRSKNRLLYHIADAPCHGRSYHESKYSDDYPNNDTAKTEGTRFMKAFSDLGMKYTFCRINNTTDTMVRELSQLSSLKIETCSLSDPSALVKLVSKSISTSVKSSVRDFDSSVSEIIARASKTRVSRQNGTSKRAGVTRRADTPSHYPNTRHNLSAVSEESVLFSTLS